MKYEKTILITGAAGFIGFHLVQRLIKENFFVIGIDNLNDYYNVKLKTDRLKELGIKEDVLDYNESFQSSHFKNFRFVKIDIADRNEMPALFKKYKFNIVCNLAAQAGVRYSLENPETYIDSNIVGFLNILECCRHNKIEHLIYASSSSVYGEDTSVPFKTTSNVDKPVSLYAATKKSNELMAYTYSHLYNLKTTGLRFFTVYGPWGRPDMAMFLFTDAIIKGKPIKVFNNGDLERDFTYIDDIVNGIVSVLSGSGSNKDYAIYNIGNSKPIRLLSFIDQIEKELEIKAKREMMPMQPGDVSRTWADVSPLQKDFAYSPKTSIEEGISKFIKWYKEYYRE